MTYVVELAEALARHPGVHRVELLTRLITDPSVDASYGVAEERMRVEADETDADKGAFIVRLAAGSPDVYLRKELLWPHIREFADRAIDHIRQTQQRLEAQHGRPFRLLALHGHYADAAEIATMVSATLGCGVVVTGHSLGRNKLSSILAQGKMTRSEVARARRLPPSRGMLTGSCPQESQYKIGRRIEAEERALDHATVVVVSTEDEIREQWGLYAGYDSSLERALSRSRRFSGRACPRMIVIPPVSHRLPSTACPALTPSHRAWT